MSEYSAQRRLTRTTRDLTMWMIVASITVANDLPCGPHILNTFFLALLCLLSCDAQDSRHKRHFAPMAFHFYYRRCTMEILTETSVLLDLVRSTQRQGQARASICEGPKYPKQRADTLKLEDVAFVAGAIDLCSTISRKDDAQTHSQRHFPA
eukprot:5549828-Amphidinium_carterae.1